MGSLIQVVFFLAMDVNSNLSEQFRLKRGFRGRGGHKEGDLGGSAAAVEGRRGGCGPWGGACGLAAMNEHHTLRNRKEEDEGDKAQS